MDQVRGSQWFYKIDLKSGYKQIRIRSGDEWKTAFMTHCGPFQLNVMTFGFMNAPSCFQHFMDDHVFNQPDIIDHVVGYLDDANTYHSSLKEHVHTNRKLLAHCRAAHITLNPKKCEFHQPKINLLGVELSKDGF